MKYWRKYRSRVLIVSALVLIAGVCIFVWNLSERQSNPKITETQAVSLASAAAPASTIKSSPEQASSVPTYSSSLPASSAAPQKSSSASPGNVLQPLLQRKMQPVEYQDLYPGLHTDKAPVKALPAGKVVYLTFDDGPSDLTEPLLNVLDRYHVKATFFVIGKTEKKDLQDMRAIVTRGHSIGMHSYSHNYKQIYADPKAFLNDFERIHTLILNTTGVDTHIYRFPGGSYNSYNRQYAGQIIAEMDRRGYTYFDWNVDSGDAKTGVSASAVYNNSVREAQRYGKAVILMHNTNVKRATLAQLPRIIETLQQKGYRFATLDETVDNQDFIFSKPRK